MAEEKRVDWLKLEGEQAAKHLIEELARADALLRGNKPAAAQLEAIHAVIQFLAIFGIFSATLELQFFNIVDALIRHKGGGAAKRIAEVFPITRAAAEVTMQVDAGSRLKDALQDACSKYEVDEKKVRKFRDNLSRGRVSKYARDLYEHFLRAPPQAR